MAKLGTNNLKRFAIYARYSSDRQAETSIEDQLALCRRRVDELGGSVVREFSDYAISGTNAERPGLRSLMQAAQDGEFDAVISEALDRLSRDQENIAGLYKRLSHRGIEIVTVGEGDVSELHIGLKGTMNALFLKDLAAKTKRGQVGAVKRGKIPGGLSYGYDAIRSEFDHKGEPVRGLRKINETEAEVVRRIFREFAAGRSPKAIAIELNADNIASPRGNGWRANAIYGNAKRGNGILHNRLYRGEIVYNRQSFFRDPDTGKRTARPNPENEWTIQSAPELAIVSEELWNHAHAALQVVTHAPDKKRPKRLLSGLVKCSVCGGSYVARGLDRMGCSTRAEKGTCTNSVHIKIPEIEKRILEALKDVLLDADLVAVFVKEYVAEMNRLERGENNRRTSLQKKLQAVSDDVEKAADAFIQAPELEALKDRLRKLQQRKDHLERELAAVRPATSVQISPAIAETYRRKVAELADLVSSDNLEATEAKAAIRSLIGAVFVHDEKNSAGRPHVELKGDLAAILAFANGNPEVLGSRMESMVAGIGFEPMTFRL